jgi:hypothetical protein
MLRFAITGMTPAPIAATGELGAGAPMIVQYPCRRYLIFIEHC